jgi:hypothetical protein
MHRVFGLIVLSAGVGFAAYSHAPSSIDREAQVAAITRIVAQGVILEPETVAAEQPGLRKPIVSSATLPAFAPAGMKSGTVIPAPSSGRGPLPTPVVTASTQTAPQEGSWATITEPIKTIAAEKPSAATNPTSRKMQRQLARQIQSELKRVGCYTGKLDGSWGDRSRAAMSAFIEHVNAVLPTTEPDVILLSLVRGQQGEICGITCPPGKIATGGRCVARTVVATATPVAPLAATTRQFSAPPPGRMAVGGPVALPDTASGTYNGVTSASPGPALAGERLPWLDQQFAPSGGASDRVASPRVAAIDQNADSWDGQTGDESDQLSDDERSTHVDPLVKPAKPTRVRPSNADRKPVTRKAQKKRRYGTRTSVQTLFLHPLGRM